VFGIQTDVADLRDAAGTRDVVDVRKTRLGASFDIRLAEGIVGRLKILTVVEQWFSTRFAVQAPEPATPLGCDGRVDIAVLQSDNLYLCWNSIAVVHVLNSVWKSLSPRVLPNVLKHKVGASWILRYIAWKSQRSLRNEVCAFRTGLDVHVSTKILHVI
jgi:hypothetical protein